MIHPITREHAQTAQAWFDAHRDHPFLKEKVESINALKEKTSQYMYVLVVFSSDRCLMCRSFFQQMIDLASQEKYQFLLQLKVVTVDFDASDEILEYLQANKPAEYPKEKWGLPVMSFLINNRAIFTFSGVFDDMAEKIADLIQTNILRANIESRTCAIADLVFPAQNPAYQTIPPVNTWHQHHVNDDHVIYTWVVEERHEVVFLAIQQVASKIIQWDSPRCEVTCFGVLDDDGISHLFIGSPQTHNSGHITDVGAHDLIAIMQVLQTLIPKEE